MKVKPAVADDIICRAAGGNKLVLSVINQIY